MQTITIDTDKLKQGSITVTQPTVFNFASGSSAAPALTTARNTTSTLPQASNPGRYGIEQSTEYWASRRETERELTKELCTKTRRVKRIKCASDAFKESQIIGFEKEAELTLNALDKLNGSESIYKPEFCSVQDLINVRRYNRD